MAKSSATKTADGQQVYIVNCTQLGPDGDYTLGSDFVPGDDVDVDRLIAIGAIAPKTEQVNVTTATPTAQSVIVTQEPAPAVIDAIQAPTQ